MKTSHGYCNGSIKMSLRLKILMAICVMAGRTTVAGDSGAPTASVVASNSSTMTASENSENSTASIDYSAFAKMLAGALVLREGGIANATRTLPYLSAVTQHYLNTQVYLNTHPKVQNMIKNFTDYHYHKDNTDLLDKIDEHIKKKGDKIGEHFKKEKDEKIEKHIQEKIDKATAKLHPAKFDKDLEELNKHLAKFHIHVQPKDISAPSKFKNDAFLIKKTIEGLSSEVSGVTWAPTLVKYGAVGLGFEATGLSITPTLLQMDPTLLSTQIQGIFVNPALLYVQPAGVAIQPQGVFVAPSLFVVSPSGVNINPAGVQVAANGFVEASTGVNVQAQAVSWGPVNHIIP
eukprot:jgi/Botrbrau1/18130/Bobra.53_1s0008.1